MCTDVFHLDAHSSFTNPQVLRQPHSSITQTETKQYLVIIQAKDQQII